MPESADPVLAAIQEAVRSTFGHPDLAVTPATTHEDVDGWDSITHVALVLAVEKACGIRFPLEQIYAFRDVGEMAGWIREHRE